MPNLRLPITTTQAALAYKERIMSVLSEGSSFEPLMTCCLTEDSNPADIEEGFLAGVLVAVKLYPAHATTNSQHGISNFSNIYPTLERLEKIGMPLLIHGECTDPGIDIFDRERIFIERTLVSLMSNFPGLKIVLEHITSRFAVDFVRTSSALLAATITPHHLLLNRNAIFAGGLRPHAYCLPVAKREEDRLALREAATSGERCFFLGTDSAPHARGNKESDCGCAGIFCAPVALETYAQVFEEESALDRLEGFASVFGANFYGLPLNRGTISLRLHQFKVQTPRQRTADEVEFFRSGESINWSIAEENTSYEVPQVSGSKVSKSDSSKPSRSAASPWFEQRPAHLPCRMGDLPPAVLFPGDPGRVDRLSKVLTDFQIVGQNREFRIGTGFFNGVKIGVCSTGIGGPSTEIALVEAASLGCKFALRVGGTGALSSSISIGSLLVVSSALRGGGAASFYAAKDRPALAHPKMLEALSAAAAEARMTTTRAIVASTDSYYAGQGRPVPQIETSVEMRIQSYRDRGADALDMEAETVLVLGEALGMMAGVVLAVHANRSTDEWLEDFGEPQDQMIRLACDALHRLVLEEEGLDRTAIQKVVLR
jgi:dihydroorotase